MTPRRRALAVLVLLPAAAAWYALGAPRLEAALLAGRAERLRSRSVAEVDAAWAVLAATRPERLPDARALAQQEAWRAAMRAVQQAEADAVGTIWGALTPAQRQEGPARIAALPPLHYDGDARFTEPEPPSLAAAIITRHGFSTAGAGVHAPVSAGLAHQQQLLAVLALVRAGALSDAQAASILAAVLELIALQKRRKRLEEQLVAQLPADLQSVSGGR